VQRLLQQQQQQKQETANENDDDDTATSSKATMAAFINTCDDFNCTPLIWACTTGDHVETVRLLLQNGAHVNHREQLGQTALWRASLCGNYQVAMLLLQEYQANASIPDAKGALPSAVADGECASIDWASFMKETPPQQEQPDVEQVVEEEEEVLADTDWIIYQIAQLKDDMQRQEATIMTLYKDHASTREKLELLLETLRKASS
jgi:hypothetical protein